MAKRQDRYRTARPLVVCGTASLLTYTAIWYLSGAFAYEQADVTRPLPLVLGLFGIAFLIHVVAIWLGLQTRSRHKYRIILGFAFAFRVVLLFSEPIQEVDIYRYLWDGMVSTAGVSPFDYAPREVLEANAGEPLSPALRTLVALRDSSRDHRIVLERVHFGELPTVYPPVSQVVFALSHLSTPIDASVGQRVIYMKIWILAFDCATIYVIAAMLRLVRLRTAWLISYAWCPLVLKEFANSGHLDAIAIFFATAAIYFACKSFFAMDYVVVKVRQKDFEFRMALISGVMLALAIGAKLYPVVFVPLLATTCQKRLGWMPTAAVGLAFMVITLACLSPMLLQSQRAEVVNAPQLDPFAPVADPAWGQEGVPDFVPRDRRAGLKAFLSQWMMNDFVFLNLAENVTPNSLRNPGVPKPWFVMLPDRWRQGLHDRVKAWLARLNSQLPDRRRFAVDDSQVPFLIARTITSLIFVGLALYWAIHAAKTPLLSTWLEYGFLTVAWFWLLLPTLNPWYWLWAMPLISFAKNRTWLAISGLLFIYYLRFYFIAHFTGVEVVGFLPYDGALFFDYVLVWVEYVPWFVCLLIAWYRRRASEAKILTQSHSGSEKDVDS